jgi:hypothetical protein
VYKGKKERDPKAAEHRATTSKEFSSALVSDAEFVFKVHADLNLEPRLSSELRAALNWSDSKCFRAPQPARMTCRGVEIFCGIKC